MEEPYEHSAGNEEPYSVLLGMLLEVNLNSLLEGKKSKACKLEVLSANGDEDDGYAVNKTEHEVDERGNKSEYEPNDVAESFHGG